MKTIKTIIALLCFLPAFSQVGVNTSTPQQALDVNGKVQIGDDSTPETNGTMRYNTTKSDFEGYNGAGWQSFTQSKNGLPSNAKMVFGRLNSLEHNSFPEYVSFYDEKGTEVIKDFLFKGKYLLITHISISPSSLNDILEEATFYSISISYGPNIEKLSGKYTGGTLYQSDAGYAPLGIIEDGDALSITNSVISLPSGYKQFESGIDIYVVGILVDDLDFN
ncbi:hypothetical protein [Mariniflexile sp.]|uniref:hypothetical protein n=1 Tax=Mariniflexile sp. TaxID=1979402 RepID=UPI0040479684